MSARWMWFAVLVAQGLLLAAIVVREEVARRSGTPVLLAVRPVDPMDLFAGRYVSVPLAIDEFVREELAWPDDLAYGDTVYVAIASDEGVWSAVELAREPRADGGVWVSASVRVATGDRLALDYGADRFYIPETGADPSLWTGETERPTLAIAARVGLDHRLTIEDLLVNGLSYVEWNRAQQSGR